METGNRRGQYLITLAVSVATVTMGVSSAWSTVTIPKFHSNETRLPMDKDDISWMLSTSAPGYIVGCFAAGFTSDWLGRRATMLWSAIPYGVGMILVASASKPWLLYMSIFLWSFATAMLSMVIALYFSEISDKDLRATLLLITRIAFHLGSLLMMCIGPFVSFDTMSYLLLALPVGYFAACWWVPESPYYYLKEGRVHAARKELRRLKGYTDEKTLEDDLMQMRADVRRETRHSSSPIELFKGTQYRRATIISAGLKITQIMSGLLTIQHYLALIVGESGIDMKISTVLIIFGAIRFVVSITPSALADRLGRRPLLIISYFGTGASLAIVGLYFFLKEVININPNKLSPYGIIPFTCIIAASIISTIGFNSIIVVIQGEIFPLNVKATAMAVFSVLGGLLSFVVARSYQPLKDQFGLCGVFWMYAAVSTFGAVFSLIFVPETKGKSLRDIQMQLQGHLYNDGEEENKLNPDVDVTTEGERVESKEMVDVSKLRNSEA